MMKIEVVSLFLLIVALKPCRGIKCWHCVNQNNNWECLLNGKLKECLPSQNECQNEIRFISNNRYFKITKGCKQDVGCDNNRKQNELFANSYQCEKKDVVDVCWCCCATENCNAEKVFCEDIKPTCELLTSPLNGVVSCHRNDGSLGTNCVYRCRAGFGLVGSARTTCVRTAYGAVWSSSAPSCVQLFCDPLPTAPERGSVSCSDGNSLYSVCRFFCDVNYILIGSSSTTCSHFGTWTDPTPLCAEVTCRLRKVRDPNLVMECTDENRLGSVCSFRCAGDYQLRGSAEITCGEPITGTLGRWSHWLPKCYFTERPCSPLVNPNGVCTNDNNVGSRCTYSCAEGEYMLLNGRIVRGGVARITCVAKSGWSGNEPTCVAITCPALSRTFANGDRLCTNGRRFRSQCTYTCGSNFRILGDAVLRCERDRSTGNGAWSSQEPRCLAPEPGAGSCVNYADVANGVVSCAPVGSGNGTHWLPGTSCAVRCQGDLLSPIGAYSNVRCTDGGWVGQLCCDRCLTTPSLDIIVLMDSSYVDEELWDVSKSFNPNFARYMTEFKNYKEVNFVIVPYATTVDVANTVRASRINSDNYETLTTLTEALPFVGTGESNTGFALKRAFDVVLGELTPGSVPLVVILTNRSPNDGQLALLMAGRLRDKGIPIRIVPLTDFYTADPGVHRAALEALTDGGEYSVVQSDSVEFFYEIASAGIDLPPTSCEDRTPAC